MQKKYFKEKYPITSVTIPSCRFSHMNEAVNYFKERVAAHPVAQRIGVFDHVAHTRSLKDGVVAEPIKEAVDLIFCFGKKLMTPEVLAVRPRSIGVCRTTNGWVVTFMEAPNAPAQEAMEGWVYDLYAYSGSGACPKERVL